MVAERPSEDPAKTAASPGVVQPRATLADVARLAQVSAKTVSRVYSHPEAVSAETKARVESAARRLHFRPNALARDLRRGGVTSTIAFVTAEFTNPFYIQVAAGIERELTANGYTMVLATSDNPEGERKVIEMLVAQRVRAVIFVPIGDDHSYLDGERMLGMGIVAIDRPARNLLADSVVLANRQGTRLAVEALVRRGHRKIAYVCNPLDVYSQQERLAGYREAMGSVGLSVHPAWQRGSNDPALPIERLVEDLLALPDPPTAVIAGNNRATIASIRAFRNADSKAALIGFDDLDLADVFGISVIAHDPGAMGAVAAQYALRRLSDPTGFTSHVELPVRYLARGSGERPPT